MNHDIYGKESVIIQKGDYLQYIIRRLKIVTRMIIKKLIVSLLVFHFKLKENSSTPYDFNFHINSNHNLIFIVEILIIPLTSSRLLLPICTETFMINVFFLTCYQILQLTLL